MEEQAWIKLMREAEASLYHLSCAMLSLEADRRDAMQETALRTWEHRRSLRDERYFKTWVTRIAVNACRDIMRKNRRVVPVDALPDCPAPESPAELYMTIERLPERLRLPQVLYYHRHSVRIHLRFPANPAIMTPYRRGRRDDAGEHGNRGLRVPVRA